MSIVFVCHAIVEFIAVDGGDKSGCRLEVLNGALKVLAAGI